jgi:hypothetical protein
MSQPIQKISLAREDLGGVILTQGDIIIESVDVNKNDTTYTLVELIEKIEDTSVIDQNILIGRLTVIFKNDGIPFEYAFTITLEGFTARGEVNKAKMLTIIVQFLFSAMELYIRQFRPTNNKGELFNLPSFGYSEASFEPYFHPD